MVKSRTVAVDSEARSTSRSSIWDGYSWESNENEVENSVSAEYDGDGRGMCSSH